MKKMFFFAVAALCAGVASAYQEQNKAPVPAANVDDAINICVLRAQKLAKSVGDASFENAFREASEAFRIKDMLADMEKSFDVKMAVDEASESDKKRLEHVKRYMELIDGGARMSMDQLARSMVHNDVVRRYWRINRVIKRVDEEGYVKELEQFSSTWLGYIDLVNEMKANKSTQVYGSELVVASGLDKYAKPGSCSMTPAISRMASSLDGCLAKVTNDELASFETAVKYVRDLAGQAAASVKGGMNAVTAGQKNLSPATFKAFADLLTNMDLFVQQALAFADDADDLIATLRDPSTNVGRLRTLKGFKVFLGGNCPPPIADGNQRYVMRIRMLLFDAKKAYLDALVICNKEARLSGQQDVRGWK